MGRAGAADDPVEPGQEGAVGNDRYADFTSGRAIESSASASPIRVVLNAITADENLLDALLAEPTVTNVYSGHYPTHYMDPRVPHDSYLADFLMLNKGFIRD